MEDLSISIEDENENEIQNEDNDTKNPELSSKLAKAQRKRVRCYRVPSN